MAKYRIKARVLRKVGITTKPQRRIVRRYIRSFPIPNRAYAKNNIAYALGYLESFNIWSTEIEKKWKLIMLQKKLW